MGKRLRALLGVRAVTCWLLTIATYRLYTLDKTEAAAAFMVLLTTAITWMFKSKSDQEVK